MESATQAAPFSKGVRWAGIIISALVSILFLMGPAFVFINPAAAAKGTEHMGYPPRANLLIPILEIHLRILSACSLFRCLMLLPAPIFLTIHIRSIATPQVTDTGMRWIDFHEEMVARDQLIVRKTNMAIIHTPKEKSVMGIKYKHFAL